VVPFNSQSNLKDYYNKNNSKVSFHWNIAEVA